MKFLRQYEKQNGVCALCGQWFAPAAMTRDHIMPRAKGGGTDWGNIQLACAPCNELKGDVIRCSNAGTQRGRDADAPPATETQSRPSLK